MKNIVSVSIGSSERNHKASIEVMGEEVVLERIGTDGDMDKAVQIIKELDGKVDAFGMGGIDLYMAGSKKKYMFREAKRIAEAAKVTPLVDGTGLKNTLEYIAVKYAVETEKVPIPGKKVLLVCAMDRIGMGEAFEEYDCDVTYGDIIFALGLPIPIKSISFIKNVGTFLMPVLTKMPFSWLYPTGDQQKEKKTTHSRYYTDKDVIAGDFLYIKRYLPERIDGKIVVTNTVTDSDVRDLKDRGASVLITTTPEIQGRSFGTNVIEAMLVSFADKPADQLTGGDYIELINKLNIKPRVVRY